MANGGSRIRAPSLFSLPGKVKKFHCGRAIVAVIGALHPAEQSVYHPGHRHAVTVATAHFPRTHHTRLLGNVAREASFSYLGTGLTGGSC